MPLCGSSHKFKISCKSRLCPACGKKYAALWADKTAASLINTKHRAILFTIPKEIREFFFYDRTLLTKLTYAVNDIFKYQFNNIKSKNQRVHKIGRYSKKYFTNSDILYYGLITVIHTFGRDLKWNPHIHAIVTLGGFNKNYKYLNKRYFHVDSIAGQWKKLVIDIVKSGNYKNKKLKKKAQIIASSLYKKDTRFSLVSQTVDKVILRQRKGLGNKSVSQMESAVGIHFRRGKQRVSRLFSRWNSSVYSSVSTSRNPDFDLGVDFVDTLILRPTF